MTYRVKVMKSGPIRSMGGAYGPIITPFSVDLGLAVALLNEGAKLIQVCDDGTEKTLDLKAIYDTTTAAKPVAPAPAPKVEPKVNPVVPEVEQVVIEEPVVEEVAVEAPVVEPVAETVEETVEETVDVEPVADGELDEVVEIQETEAPVVEEPVKPTYNQHRQNGKKKKYVK